MNTSPVDPSLALQEAATNDLVRRKMDMDALRKRLGDSTTKQEKLRESCEGFEAIFLQKMWEQMRKNVPKEGFLHSKDEETYQSLFDIELCKKMAGAGGIGLADMLYTQLSQQLEHTGRTTTPSKLRTPLNVPPSKDLSPYAASGTVSPASPPQADNKKMTATDLYSPLPAENEDPESDDAGGRTETPAFGVVESALKDLKVELGLSQEDVKGAAAAEWAAARAAMTGTTPPPTPGAAPGPAFTVAPSVDLPPLPGAALPAAGQAAHSATDPFADEHRPRQEMRPVADVSKAPVASPAPGSVPPRAPAPGADAVGHNRNGGAQIVGQTGQSPVNLTAQQPAGITMQPPAVQSGQPLANHSAPQAAGQVGQQQVEQQLGHQAEPFEPSSASHMGQQLVSQAGQPPVGPAGAHPTGTHPAPTRTAEADPDALDAAATGKKLSRPVDPSLLSWQGNGPVSIKPKPSSMFGRNKNRAKGKEEAGATAQATERGLAPQETLWPMEGVVTNRFGWEDDAATGKRRWNAGVTIAAPANSPVRAVLAGRVVYAGPREGYGNTVVLEHKDGFRSYYGNLQNTTLKIGDKIKLGANFAKIAEQPASSSSGENSASLHFEIKKGEMALNPESAIRQTATTASR